MRRNCGDDVQLLKLFSLRIFVAEAYPDGLRIVERSNCVGRALVYPRVARAHLSEATQPVPRQAGVDVQNRPFTGVLGVNPNAVSVINVKLCLNNHMF